MLSENPEIIILIVAAGSGVRAGQSVPKQYALFQGQMLLAQTVGKFTTWHKKPLIQIVIHPDHHAFYEDFLKKHHHPHLLPVCYGGDSRQESVKNGLHALQTYQPDIVFIQDAARPFISYDFLDSLYQKIKHPQIDAVVPAIPPRDSLRLIGDEGTIKEILPREKIRAIQTPQVFSYRSLMQAYDRISDTELCHHTDDSSIAMQAGITVHTLAGSDQNLKITYAEDFNMPQAPSFFPNIRIGSGYDVHAFDLDTPSKEIILGGISLPHPYKLKGHSDADVVLHALTDAILGAGNLQDIGYHFPPSDVRWRGADSGQFVTYALDLLQKKGGHLHYADITIICEAPKISPYREKMQQKIADLCGVHPDKISVKATTTEKLGFTGRKEGIACHAMTTVYFDR